MSKSKRILSKGSKGKVASVVESKSRTYLSQSDVPAFSLDQAIRVPSAIAESYGSKAVTPLQLADAMMMQPTSGTFRQLCGAAIAYGLTLGGYNANAISLAPLGKQIVTPQEEDEDLAGKREAVLRPRVLQEFLRRYDGSPLPRVEIAVNVLAVMGVPRDRADAVYRLIQDSAQSVGFIREIKGRQYVDLLGTEPRSTNETEVVGDESEDSKDDQRLRSNGQHELKPQQNNNGGGTLTQSLGQAIFIGHGRSKTPLAQLKGILEQFKIPFKIAIEEPNLGRPIGTKVSETLRECNCAILIFTADDEFRDKDGNTVWRPSENVIHELGAASYLYGTRIVVLKEDCVQLPTNFRDICYISFSRDALSARAMEVLKELIGFGIVKVST